MSKLFVASLALLAACGGGPDPRLAPLARARLEAGVGLGDLKLGRTTLGEFFDRFGAGRTAFVAGDGMGFELFFESGQIVFLFSFEEGTRWDDEEGKDVRRATGDLGKYLEKYPHRRDLPLTSISVRADEDKESTFYQGQLAQGIALFDPFLKSVGRVGMSDERAILPMLAGLTPNTPREKASFPEEGLVLYGERNPQPGTPSRVTRMTVFLPASSREATDEDAGD